jgi:glyoxylase-like metal-dependent hydrolase (beta-lactamase superfamily II)
VQRGELEWARRPTPRDRVSYPREVFAPLEEAGCLASIEGEVEIAPGVRVVRLPGHTPNLQGVIVEGGGLTLLFPSDLVPTACHLPFAWIMAYDLEPLVTLETKIATLRRAAERGWILVLQHEARTPVGTVRMVEDRPLFDPRPEIA